MKRYGLVVLLLACTFGCAYRVPPVYGGGNPAPTVTPSVVGLMIVDTECNDCVTPESHAKMWKQLQGLLERAADVATSRTGERLAVRVEIEASSSMYDSMRRDGFAVFGFVAWAPFGGVVDWERLSVEVTVARKGQALTGRGTAEMCGSVYASARARALAVALRRALAELHSQSSSAEPS